jgi:hypothetical protein
MPQQSKGRIKMNRQNIQNYLEAERALSLVLDLDQSEQDPTSYAAAYKTAWSKRNEAFSALPGAHQTIVRAIQEDEEFAQAVLDALTK